MVSNDLGGIARILAVSVVGAVLCAASPAYGSSTARFELHDSRVDEASGIGRGIVSPGVFYVQNDSGDSARFFALDAQSGDVRAVYSVPNAQSVDWEDLAVAPDSRGRPSVWLADIGDNDAQRDEVQLYRVDEPAVDRSREDVAARTSPPDVWRLRYPSGAVNAESLAVTPMGRAYVLTKSPTGRSVMYAVPPHPDADRVQTMQRVGAITFETHGGPVPRTLQVSATGAAFSADGAMLAVRTYTDAYVWSVPRGDVAAALRAGPTRVKLPLQPQGEGICFDGSALVIDSERDDSAVYRVSLPSPPRVTASPSESSTALRPSSAVSSSSSPSAAPAAPAAHSDDGHGPLLVVGGVVVALGLVGAIAMGRRRSGE